MNIKKRGLLLKAVWLYAALAFFCLQGMAQEVTTVYIDNIEEEVYNITTPGNYKIIGNNTPDNPTSKHIFVNVDGEVNITIENVNISADNYDIPFSIYRGTVNLTLSGKNSLICKTKYSCPGLLVSEKASLTITEESNGSFLKAQVNQPEGYSGGAGIGSTLEDIAGSITINGGTIQAIGGTDAAGIGGGAYGSASSITINGGYVTAIAGTSSSGIPASIGGGSSASVGKHNNGGDIKITGGTVITLDGNGNIGSIGNGKGGTKTSVTITGGSVYYNSSIRSVTPKDGNGNELVKKEISGLSAHAKITGLNDADGYNITDIYADANGKAYLWLPTSSNPSVKSYLKPFSLNITCYKDDQIWTNHNKTFTVKNENENDEIVSVNNYFYLKYREYTIYANGENTNLFFIVLNNDKQDATVDYYTATYNLNYDTGNLPASTTYTYLKGTRIKVGTEANPVRDYYTFEGWGTSPDATEKVEIIGGIIKPEELYAIWKPKEFTTKADVTLTATYRTSYNYTFDEKNLSEDILSNSGGLKKIALKDESNLPDGLIFDNDKTISGIPETVDETGREGMKIQVK